MCAVIQARSKASGVAPMLVGWCSHLTNSRTSSPWLWVVWTQSIHGRRMVASIGPLPPTMSIGARSSNALKMAIVACIRPTFEWIAAAIARPRSLA